MFEVKVSEENFFKELDSNNSVKTAVEMVDPATVVLTLLAFATIIIAAMYAYWDYKQTMKITPKVLAAFSKYKKKFDASYKVYKNYVNKELLTNINKLKNENSIDIKDVLINNPISEKIYLDHFQALIVEAIKYKSYDSCGKLYMDLGSLVVRYTNFSTNDESKNTYAVVDSEIASYIAEKLNTNKDIDLYYSVLTNEEVNTRDAYNKITLACKVNTFLTKEDILELVSLINPYD